MPATTSTVDPNLLRQYSAYFDPSAFQGGGNQPSGHNQSVLNAILHSGGALGPLINPGGTIDLFTSLFGGHNNDFRPYVDAQGNYVWQDPHRANPVPVANVPGAALRPGHIESTMANQVQAIVNLLPYYSQAVSGQIIPQAQALLAAQQATSPGLAQLMTQLYGTYGTQLNDIGNQIARTNALSQVGTDTAALNQANTTLIPAALQAARQYDPEYFATRELAANRLKDLLSSINLGTGLSSTERREVEQGLANEGQRRGTLNAPSNLATVSNAMQYGQAGYNRLQQNRSALSSAIANATSSLPGFKSGTDVFQVATGRSSTPNMGNAVFPGINNVSGASNNVLGLASGINSILGGASQFQLGQNQINAQKKDWADYLSQVTSSIGNLAGVAGGIACWIARRVYGVDNPKWLMFRDWLFTKASRSFREFYLANGERLSHMIDDLSAAKIRFYMDIIIEKHFTN